MENQVEIKTHKTGVIFPWLTLVAMALMLFACSSKEIRHERGIEVWMTDSPASYEAFNVVITKVEANVEGEGWVTMSEEEKEVDVLTLTNGTAIMLAGSDQIDAETVSKFRLTFGENSTLTTGGLELGLEMEANADNELTAEIPVFFESQAESSTRFLLDFNVAASIIETEEEYILEPEITWVQDAETGITGKVQTGLLLTSKAFIKCLNGHSEVSAYSDAQGEFRIQGLEPGAYDVFIEGRNELGITHSTTIEDVMVAEGEIYSMGTITLSN